MVQETLEIRVMLKNVQYGLGFRHEVTIISPGEGNNVSKKWKSDLVGYDPSGNLCVIDVNVISLAVASYRGTRRTLKSRCLRALNDAVKKKLQPPHAAA